LRHSSALRRQYSDKLIAASASSLSPCHNADGWPPFRQISFGLLDASDLLQRLFLRVFTAGWHLADEELGRVRIVVFLAGGQSFRPRAIGNSAGNAARLKGIT